MLRTAKRLTGLTLLVFASLTLVACSGSVPDQLTDTYRNYTSQIAAGKGHQAAKWVTEDTVTHYEKLGDLALRGGREMSSLGLHDELCVYFLRARYDAVALEKFTGRDVMNILVKAKLVGEDGMERFSLGDIRYTENEARADLVDGNQTTAFEIWFARQDGSWKVDPARFRAKRDELLERRIVQFEGDRDSVLGELLKTKGITNGLTPELKRPLK